MLLLSILFDDEVDNNKDGGSFNGLCTNGDGHGDVSLAILPEAEKDDTVFLVNLNQQQQKNNGSTTKAITPNNIQPIILIHKYHFYILSSLNKCADGSVTSFLLHNTT